LEVIKTTVTLEKIDLEKRKVTLLLDDGKRKTFKVGKSVQNLEPESKPVLSRHNVG